MHIFIFRATIDQDEDGDISQEEFIKNAMNSQFIAEVLKERKKKVSKWMCVCVLFRYNDLLFLNK